MQVSVIIACAGKGERAKQGKNKLLVSVSGKTAVERVYFAFKKTGLIKQYIICAAKRDEKEIADLLSGEDYVFSAGGETRTESVKNALSLVTGDVVLIHDGARPFVSARIIKDVIAAASEKGGAITAVPTRDTIYSVKDEKYLGKNGLYLVQTPQGFRTELIKKAYSLAGNGAYNDDGEVYKTFIGELAVVNGETDNVKITYPEDLLLLNRSQDVRFGTGFDCHELVTERKLILGGIEIPHEKGLKGHSDADVLTHAVMDALLSAAAERDIGYHFPDNDPKYEGADSMMLLKKVLSIIERDGYRTKSVSAVIMAQKPKLLGYIPKITVSLAEALGIPAENVGITATTLEGLGFVGREEGICVHANAVIVKKD